MKYKQGEEMQESLERMVKAGDRFEKEVKNFLDRVRANKKGMDLVECFECSAEIYRPIKLLMEVDYVYCNECEKQLHELGKI